MLDLQYIRENTEEVRNSIQRRRLTTDLDRWIKLDARRAELVPQVDDLRAQLKIEGKPTPEQLAALQKIKHTLGEREQELTYVEREWRELWSDIPNIIAEDTPDGGEESNREDSVGLTPRQLDFQPKDHLELNETLQFVDFEAGTRLAGSRFYILKSRGVRLWQACVSLISQMATEAGFELTMVPHMVSDRVAEGTGYLPRGEERQIYRIEGEDLNLIATSEIPLTGMHADQVIDLAEPQLYAGLSTCYRMEAGTYGKYAKGLFRVHQFDKLELYAYTTPKDSPAMLSRILELEEKICQALEIPYRVLRIAAGDLSAPAAHKYDLEYWSPTDDTWRELTSCSNCTDYQARRLNIRYRAADGKLQHPHTLNGTAITSSRTLVALIENGQTADGSVKLPAALRTFYGGEFL